MWTYKARLLRVVDGDTYDFEVDMGFYMRCSQRFRLLGVDTPELRRGSEKSKQAGRDATEFVKQVLGDAFEYIHPSDDRDSFAGARGSEFPLEITTHKSDSFGRWLVDVRFGMWAPGDDPDDPPVLADLGTLLLEAGHAVPYKKKKR